MKECMKQRPNPTAKFNFAWALIRSKDVCHARIEFLVQESLQTVFMLSQTTSIDSFPLPSPCFLWFYRLFNSSEQTLRRVS